MRVHDFLLSATEAVRKKLLKPLKGFDQRFLGSLVQFHYGMPKLHFEIWVQGQYRRIELGLHFEADKETNDRLLTYFAERFIEVQANLGPQVELERWTASWSRIHETMPYTTLDAALVNRVADRMAAIILVLQPMLDCARREKR